MSKLEEPIQVWFETSPDEMRKSHQLVTFPR